MFKNLLDDFKNKRDGIDKSGIYEIQRSCCNVNYVGQRKHRFRKKFRGHSVSYLKKFLVTYKCKIQNLFQS